MDLTLAEEYLLLALDDASGRPLVDSSRLHAAVAAAALVDLTVEGSLEIADVAVDVKAGRFRRTGRVPADPLLAAIADEAHGRKPKDAVSRIAGLSSFRNQSGRLREQLLTGLADRGVLRQESGRILGLFPTTTWPMHDGTPELLVRTRVRSALVSDGLPDPRTGALVSLLSATDLVAKAFPELDRRAAKRRAAEIAKADWAGPAVTKALQDMAAAMAAITAATAAGAASSGGS